MEDVAVEAKGENGAYYQVINWTVCLTTTTNSSFFNILDEDDSPLQL